MSKKADKKVIKKLIIIMVIILLILCAVLGIFSKLTQNENTTNTTNNPLEQLNYINDKSAWNDEEYPYTAYMLFMEYKGELSSENVVKSMSYVAKQVIPEYYKKLKKASEEEIIKYFKQNSEKIEIDIGIYDEDDFVNFIKSIQSLNDDELEFSSYKVDKDNIKKSTIYTEATLFITYKDNEEKAFKVRISNTMKEDRSSLTYLAVE